MMISGAGSHLKEIIAYLKRVNEANSDCLAWRWYGTNPEPEIEIYEELIQGQGHTLCIAKPEDVIKTMKRYLANWGIEDPDDVLD